MQIVPFFDSRTWTLTYLVWDENTRDAVVIDPVLDYDPLAVRIYEESLRLLMDRIDGEQLKLRAILETHAHADHLTGAQKLRERYGAPVIIGKNIIQVQAFFKGIFNMDLQADGSAFDRLVEDGELVEAGSLLIQALSTPGHTPACVTWKIGDALFTGDALFMPDFGTGRCDFPNGSAEELYRSVQKLYRLPDETRVFVGHDYQPGGRPVRYESTIGEEKASNIQLNAATEPQQYVAFRNSRDRGLHPPNLIFQSIQVNIAAGKLPDPEANGRSYLKLPIGLFG